MKKIILIANIILLLIIQSNVNAEDVTLLVKDYQKCNNDSTCMAIEMKMIKQFLMASDLLQAIEEMPEDEEIRYEIINSHLASAENNDYVIKIVIDRLGFIAVLVEDSENEKYVTLPIIEKGYIYNVHTKDVTGDGKEELIFNGYGTGTGYSSEWTALYKYRGNKMEPVWSGFKKEVSVNSDITEEIIAGSIDIYNMPGKKSKGIYQNYCVRKTDNKTNKTVDEECLKKTFLWSRSDFRFIEINKDKKP
jgi:hypothetical protein